MVEIKEMGRVQTAATIANLKDLRAAERGLIFLPLEHLDFVVDLRSRTLIGNPAHGGEHVYELL